MTAVETELWRGDTTIRRRRRRVLLPVPDGDEPTALKTLITALVVTLHTR